MKCYAIKADKPNPVITFAKIVETQSLATHLKAAHSSGLNLEHVCGRLVHTIPHLWSSGTYVWSVRVCIGLLIVL